MRRLFVLFAACGFLVMSCSSTEALAQELIPTQEDPFLSVGQIWQKKCAKCHGSEGKATKIGTKLGSPEDIYKASEDKTREDIFFTIAEGRNKMPGFKKKLSTEDIQNLALHIEYTMLLHKVRKNRKRAEEEIKRIKEEYKDLPECKN